MKIEASEIEQLRQLNSLDELIDKIGTRNLLPGWIPRPNSPFSTEMHSGFVPAHWRWTEAREALNAAAGVISTELAERRNLILRNPVAGNRRASDGNLPGRDRWWLRRHGGR